MTTRDVIITNGPTIELAFHIVINIMTGNYGCSVVNNINQGLNCGVYFAN